MPPVDDVTIEWVLSGRGWADCTVRVGADERTWSASYLTDSLADLTSAAAALVEGAPSCEIRFEEEPSIVVLALIREQPNLAVLTATRFSDRPIRKDEGELLISARCNVARFGRGVSSALARLLAKHGEAGYRDAWVNHAFPSAEHERLKEALRRQAS